MLTEAFVILNSFLIGLGLAGLAFVRSVLQKSQTLRKEAESARDKCLEALTTVSEAHNGLAKRLLKLEDMVKAVELRTPQKPVSSFR